MAGLDLDVEVVRSSNYFNPVRVELADETLAEAAESAFTRIENVLIDVVSQLVVKRARFVARF